MNFGKLRALKRAGGGLLWLGAVVFALLVLGYITGIFGAAGYDDVSPITDPRRISGRLEESAYTPVPVKAPAILQAPAPEPVRVAARTPTPIPTLKPEPKSQVTRLAPPPVRPAWVRFAAVRPPESGRPKIVVVIDDLGLNPKAVAQLAALEGPLTLAFLPYAEGLPLMAAQARARGHELIVHLPMEPKGSDSDPGPMALLSGLSDREFSYRLAFNLDRFDGYVGVNNHMGSALTEDRRAMDRVMGELARRGLLYLDSRTTPLTVAERLASDHGVPNAARDIFLDNEQSARAVAANLREAERVAQKTGLAIVIGHPHAETIAALGRWLPAMRRKGFQLVPLSAAVTKPPPAMRAEGPSPAALVSAK